LLYHPFSKEKKFINDETYLYAIRIDDKITWWGQAPNPRDDDELIVETWNFRTAIDRALRPTWRIGKTE
jgi:hypothetical protein